MSMEHGREDEGDELAREARAFGRHLVRAEPGPELEARYAQACRLLLPEPPGPRESAVLGFARRHPWALGALDAAAAWLEPQGALRSRLLLLCAVLEASPRFADEFLERPAPAPAALARLAAIGLAAGARLSLGLVLFPIARASRP